jgi:hypothetical protein
MPINPIPERVNLATKYSLGLYSDGRKVTLAAEIAAGRLQKAAFADLYARYTTIGWSEAKIGQLTPFCAAWENEVWGTNPLPVMNGGKPFFCGSRVAIEMGMGLWAINYPLTWHFGKGIGNGPGYVYPDARSPKGYGGTAFEHWADAWIDDDGFTLRVNDLGTTAHRLRPIFRSTTYGFEGTVGAYHELAELDQFAVNGPYGNGFKSGVLYCGVVGWDMGSASRIGNLYITNVDAPLVLVRSTPAQVEKLTAMNGNVAGILSIGGAGGTVHVKDYECDDFPCKFMARAQLTAAGAVVREAGGAIKVDFGKTETGVTPEQRGPWKGTIIADLKGQFAAQFDMDSLATAFVKVDSAFVLDPTLEGGQPQECRLEATVKRFDCGANSIHVVKGPVYPARVGPYGSAKIEWTTADGCRVNGVVVQPVVAVGASKRLGFQRWNGTAWAPAFNHAAGTPAYVFGTETAPPPTGGGTTPPPPPPPPPSTTPLYSATNVRVTSGSYTLNITDVPGVTRIVLTDYVQTGTPNYSSFATGADTATAGNYVSVWPDGTWNTPAGKCTVSKAGNVTTITLPAPMTIVRMGTFQGAGGALLYTASKVEVF